MNYAELKVFLSGEVRIRIKKKYIEYIECNSQSWTENYRLDVVMECFRGVLKNGMELSLICIYIV